MSVDIVIKEKRCKVMAFQVTMQGYFHKVKREKL